MAPTIRIDDEVYAWLQSQARPFEDTPNSVLRRFAGFDKRNGEGAYSKKQRVSATTGPRGEKTPQGAFRAPILSLLNKHGGEVHRGRALQELETSMADQLTQYDKSDISSGTIRWQKSAEWEVRVMREEGLLKPVSETPRGVWALSDKGWEAGS